ncbi:MAG: 2,3-bisphosphoglycerate-independent phosphoglycerate mutase [Patescibacteria group bacterium]
MTEAKAKSKPIVLAILDGWGLSPTWRGNAITFSNPTNIDRLWRTYPHTVLRAFQPPEQTTRRQIGSSDIGHAMIGSGREIRSDLEEIDEAITTGIFVKNPTLLDTMRAAIQKKRPLHLIGLASDGGIHSDLATLRALLDLAKLTGVETVHLHLITDGRDVAPTSAPHYLTAIQDLTKEIGLGGVASLVGRHYAMDRDGHWDRTLVAYKLWTAGVGQAFGTPLAALTAAYAKNRSDEFLPPSLIKHGTTQSNIQDNDCVIVWNARADRLKQLTQAFINPVAFRGAFGRQARLLHLTKFATLVSAHLPTSITYDIAFPPAQIPTTLPQILSGRGLSQLRAAESEKYAHISYFFGGGREEPFPGEERLIVPSPSGLPAQNPGMATSILVKRFCDRLERDPFDFAVINIANVDLVGHSGDLFATAAAIRIADKAMGELAETVLKLDGTLLITADHGNAEQMLLMPGEPDRTHTINPVPFIYVANQSKFDLIKQAMVGPAGGLADLVRARATLADIAPTILEMFQIPIPVEMTGRSLLPSLVIANNGKE